MEEPLHVLPVEIILQIFHKLHTIADALALASTCSRLRGLFHRGRNKEEILESVAGPPGGLDGKYDMKEAFSGKDVHSNP